MLLVLLLVLVFFLRVLRRKQRQCQPWSVGRCVFLRCASVRDGRKFAVLLRCGPPTLFFEAAARRVAMGGVIRSAFGHRRSFRFFVLLASTRFVFVSVGLALRRRRGGSLVLKLRAVLRDAQRPVGGDASWKQAPINRSLRWERCDIANFAIILDGNAIVCDCHEFRNLRGGDVSAQELYLPV